MAIEHADFAGVERLALVTGIKKQFSSIGTWVSLVAYTFIKC